MSPEQQRFLLATYGPTGQTATMLLSDDGIAHAKAGLLSGSSSSSLGDAFATTTKGICRWLITRVEGERWPRSEHILIVPWNAIRTHRATLTAAQLDRLREANREAGEYDRTFPRFRIPEDIAARRVGPSQDLHPADLDAYHAARERFAKETLKPWHAEARRLRDARADAVRACLPLATDTEPVDLLDHLSVLTATGGRP